MAHAHLTIYDHLFNLNFNFKSKKKEEEDLDPEDVELDEHYTIETRSKCKIALDQQIINRVVWFCFSFFSPLIYIFVCVACCCVYM